MVSRNTKLLILLLVVISSVIVFFILFPYTIAPAVHELIVELSIYAICILVFSIYTPKFSEDTKQNILGFFVVISTITFFLQFPSIETTEIVQLMAELCIAVTSYMFLIQYFQAKPKSATIEELNKVFDAGTGKILIIQNTNKPEHNFLNLSVDRKHVELYPAAAALQTSKQNAQKGIVYGTIGSLILPLFLIWVHSILFTTDVILLLLLYAVMALAMVFVAVVISLTLKEDRNPIEIKRIVEFRKSNPNINITCKISQRQLPKDTYFDELKLSLPIDKLGDELFTTSLAEEINKNKDKASGLLRFLLSVNSKLVKYPTSLALASNSDNVKIIDTPISEETSKKFLSKSILIFALHDKEMLENFHQNLLRWAVKTI